MRQMPHGEKEEEPHMKTKRILSLLMAGALLTGALTGCGSKKDDSAQSGDNSGVITINYPTFQCGTNTSAPVCDELIKEFNEKYAGKYEIKKEDVPGDQNYIDKIKVQLGTGDLPPVIYGGGYNLLDMVVAKDLAVDLTDAVNSDADWKALYSDTALATNSRDGKIYASSMEGQVIGYFYNKDLFQQAGITETPETWTEFMEACQKLKDAGINAVTCDDAYMTLIPNNYLARLVGSDTIAAMSASASDPAWQSEEVKQAFAAMETLSPFMSPQTATNKYPAGQQEFALGEAAMYLNASWMPSEVADTAGEDFPWGFFAFPQVEDGAEGSGYVSVGGVPLAVYSGSPNPEAAKEFLRYVASKEVQDYLAEQGGAPATVGSEWPGARAECTDVIAAADKVASLNCDLSSEFVSAVFTMEMNKVLTQQTTADKAVSTLTGEASKY